MMTFPLFVPRFKKLGDKYSHPQRNVTKYLPVTVLAESGFWSRVEGRENDRFFCGRVKNIPCEFYRQFSPVSEPHIAHFFLFC